MTSAMDIVVALCALWVALAAAVTFGLARAGRTEQQYRLGADRDLQLR